VLVVVDYCCFELFGEFLVFSYVVSYDDVVI